MNSRVLLQWGTDLSTMVGSYTHTHIFHVFINYFLVLSGILYPSFYNYLVIKYGKYVMFIVYLP